MGAPGVSRRSPLNFHCEPLQELSRQLRFSPPQKQTSQLHRTERLHDEIDPVVNYPLDYLVYRITGYRPAAGDSVLLVGAAVLPDLRLIIDALSRSVDPPVTAGEPAESVAQLACRLRVSTKTISRWRRAGLRWRWVRPAAGTRKRIGFSPEAVERFVAAHPERVEKAARFTQMGSAQRRKLIEGARRIAQASAASLNQVAAQLARETGRALETIRLIIEQHDAATPPQRIFTNHDGPLSSKQKRLIVRAHGLGISANKIAKRVGRARSTVYRVIQERRAAAARRVSLPFVASPTFDRPDAGQVILRSDPPPPAAGHPPPMSVVPVEDLPEPLRALYRQPVLDNQRQRSLFIRYNYLKYKASKLRDALDRTNPRAADLDTFEMYAFQASQLRSLLVNRALPVVLSVAKRHLIGQTDRSVNRLVLLLAMGHEVLIEAVDSFNATRSQRFDSFLTNQLMRRFASESAPGPGARPKAQRRLTPEQMLNHLIEAAGKSGVKLEPPT